MAINRRRLLGGFAAASAVGLMPVAPVLARQDHMYLSSRQLRGRQFATLISDEGEVRLSVEIPGRGHGGAFSARRQEAILFARRPGNFATVLSTKSNRQIGEFQCRAGRHFFGHGFYSPDGQFLYATENDYEADQSYLGIYEVEQGFRPVGQINCQGIGAHQVVLMSDRRTAVVAIGGISTHPDYPRQKLNIPSMAPGLTYVDIQAGRVLAHYPVPEELHKLSLRHLTEGPNRSIIFGCQYQGSKRDQVPLIGVKRWRSPALEFIALPAGEAGSLRHYVGSVMSNLDHTKVAISSPRGGRLLVLDGEDLGVLDARQIEDVCGIGPTQTSFVFSSGDGMFTSGLNAQKHQLEGAWDNHLTPLI